MSKIGLRKYVYIVLPVPFRDWDPEKVEPVVVLARSEAQAAAAYGAVYLQRPEDAGSDERAPYYPYVYEVKLSTDDIKAIFAGSYLDAALEGGAVIVSPYSTAGREVIDMIKRFVLTWEKAWEENDG